MRTGFRRVFNLGPIDPIETAYSNYYDSLTEDEISEQQVWGAFSESQI